MKGTSISYQYMYYYNYFKALNILFFLYHFTFISRLSIQKFVLLYCLVRLTQIIQTRFKSRPIQKKSILQRGTVLIINYIYLKDIQNSNHIFFIPPQITCYSYIIALIITPIFLMIPSLGVSTKSGIFEKKLKKILFSCN